MKSNERKVNKKTVILTLDRVSNKTNKRYGNIYIFLSFNKNDKNIDVTKKNERIFGWEKVPYGRITVKEKIFVLAIFAISEFK